MVNSVPTILQNNYVELIAIELNLIRQKGLDKYEYVGCDM